MSTLANLTATAPLALPGQRIGLFGGSFNPVHDGHLAISLEALKRLHLDCIWWLVSPQNPLKDPLQYAALDQRIGQARSVARHPRIHVTGLEAVIPSRYTADTINVIERYWHRSRFVWIMGADSLAQFHQWQDWQGLASRIPLAVVNRPGFTLKALSSPAARRYARYRLDECDAAQLAACDPPAWCFLQVPLRQESSTRIRTGHDA